MRAIDKLKEVTKFLKGCGIEAPQKEAEMLLQQGIRVDTVKIYRDNPKLCEEEIRALEDMIRRRRRREPLQYILGYEEFLGLKLLLGPGVFIPRPETEFMAEQAIKAVTSYKLQVASENKDSSLVTRYSSLRILDLCTGSGCLALTLAREFPNSEVYGTDISEITIEYANKNAEINGIKNATFLKGDLFEPIKRLLTSYFSLLTFDLIISNPPYIKTDDIKNLQPEIKDWEPVTAIDGGADGLNFYRELIPIARSFLKDDGFIMLELGIGQSNDVADILKLSGYTQVEIIKDYAGIERIIHASRRALSGEDSN